MNRRDFLLTAASVAGLPSAVRANVSTPLDYDVVVVGAGLSGLAAARLLAGQGKRVVVLEAMDRVGGRVWSERVHEDIYIDIGGQWIGSGHKRMYDLVQQSGTTYFSTPAQGSNLLKISDRSFRYRGDMPSLGMANLLSVRRGIRKIARLATQVASQNIQRSKELDRISFGDWIDKTIHRPLANLFIKKTAEGELCLSSYDVSLLQVLLALAGSGSLEEVTRVEDGALQHRILGGAQTIANFLSTTPGVSVNVSEPVIAIRQSEDLVTVVTGRRQYTSRKAILSLPAAQILKINFSPSLPERTSSLFKGMRMGRVVKTHTVYPSPFWRHSQLSGFATDMSGTIDVTVDNSIPSSKRGVLTSLIHADHADAFLKLPPEEQQQQVLTSYSAFFGPEALNPEFFHTYSFCDNPWIGGAYSGFFKDDFLTRYGEQFARPIGNLHFAGTETSSEFRGFMEGAVRSGERAATEILQSSK